MRFSGLSPIGHLMFLLEHPAARHDIALALRRAGDPVAARLVERIHPASPASLIDLARGASSAPPGGSRLADLLLLLALFHSGRRPPMLPDRIAAFGRVHPLEIFLAHRRPVAPEVWTRWSPN